MAMTEDARPAHSAFDDLQGLAAGSMFVALGLDMVRTAGLLTGGTAGLAFLLHYATGWRFGLVFFVINLPFYWLAVRMLGWRFTLKTFAAIGAVSALTELLPHWIGFAVLDPVYAGVMGGLLTGAGLLMLFRHRASLGGVGILALYLQEHRGWRAGKIQMAIDCTIVLASFTIVPPWLVAISVLGAVALNLVLAVNHKPGRYMGV